MGKYPYCTCGKYHFDANPYHDRDKNETVYFCSNNHRNEYIKKKTDPSYKDSNDRYMDELRAKQEAEKAARKAKFDELFEEMDNNSNNKSQPKSNPSNSNRQSHSSFDKVLEKAQKVNSEREKREKIEKEEKSRVDRAKRAKELRSEGKNVQAFILEFQNSFIWKIWDTMFFSLYRKAFYKVFNIKK